MIRSVLVAALALALFLPAAPLPVRADTRDGLGAATAPMSLSRLRRALARDMERGGADVLRPRRNRAPAFVPGRGRPGGTRILPDRCYDAVRTRAGLVSGYAAGCMRDAITRPDELPDRCLARVRGPGGARGFRILYDARCLRSQGWSSRAARR